MTMASMRSPVTPLVSIVLPTYNRAAFLEEAFASIRAQQLADWELVVIDDGSTDGTREVVAGWQGRVAQPVVYVHQANRGAYGARNTGLDHARGKYVAFFDSDDLWLPHHLQRCVDALERNADVGWVFAACRCVDQAGTVVTQDTFVTEGGARTFLALTVRRDGDLRIIVDPAVVECHIKDGLYAGLQNSVIRADVFASERFWEEAKVVEDAHFLTRALARGLRIGYLHDVHVIYRIHGDNSSGSATTSSYASLARICHEQIAGLERIGREVSLTASQRRAWRENLAHHLFWRLGYACHWASGDVTAALRAQWQGLRLTPGDVRMWKTYLLCLVRAGIGAVPRPAGA